jgi:hypothetical protein
MTLQHHFVVVVEDGRAYVDTDTTDHKFYEGSVWNEAIKDWEANYEHAGESEQALELLQDLLMRRAK